MSESYYSVCQSGKHTTNSFIPNRGMRQGFPLPLFFLSLICVEKLSHAIMNQVVLENWKSLEDSRNGPRISLLICVNDLIIFSEGSMLIKLVWLLTV